MEFSITGRVRTDRNDFFYFLSFLAFPNLFWLENLPKWWFLVFLIFFCNFLEISITRRVGTHLNDFYFFCFFFLSFSAFPYLFWLGKKQQWCFLIFLSFLAIFFNILLRVGQELIETILFFLFFYFLSFSAFPKIFWLEKKPQWCFLIF